MIRRLAVFVTCISLGFVAGLVAWRTGELQDEVRRGAWHVLDPDATLVLRQPDGLWEELVRRAELRANGI